MKKVAVAMSGGVDSSVSAALLKKQGYEVFGVFFHLWEEETPENAADLGKFRKKACCSLESQHDARRVAQQLGIKFYTLNLKESFKEVVIDDFIRSYQEGKTPNPCVRCNKFLKFGEALDKVKALGADYLATGHYANIETDHDGIVRLYEGSDANKDQTYFMHQLSQEQLKHLIFPLTGLTKPEVRELAREFDLPNADKTESQGLCFIAYGDVGDFLARQMTQQEGDIRDAETKEVLGRHQGLEKFTIGQRKGIGLGGGPWFVYKADQMNNVLWVTKNEELLGEKEMNVQEIHWMSGQEPDLPMKVRCRVRYRSEAVPARVEKSVQGYKVVFDQPQRAITPGQSAVFYRQNECLGGGVIVEKEV